ncbi:ATP-binding protein [Rhizomonospora bruguierae]|uniref:ATP-binding protein n=1 Tax=Rhizomonospora bruguierae TaxID=1581705 RepID=UPI001BCD3D9F|nr:ATP-binding protein [Micromonospora sp. NBRC 107566]
MTQRDAVTGEGSPFSAMVGQLSLRTALLLTTVDPTIGGVLIRGEPGTGKSTAVRSLRSLLPPIDVVEGCEFNCDPAEPAHLCAACQARRNDGEHLSVVQRPVPMITLPLGATEDRLLGTLDLETALHDGRRRLSPGILAEVNRGFLYVDEVNLAADHLMDAMLDAASSGVHHIERDGMSVTHAARFSLIGTMNPGEGGLRPQILDRFGLSVDVEAVRDPRLRAQVLARHLELERSSERRRRYQALDRDLAERVVKARAVLPGVTFPDPLLTEIGSLTAALGVASHRADLVILRTASACAALGLREEVTARDTALAAVFTLRHRTAAAGELLAEVAARLLPGEDVASVEDLLRANGEPWPTLDCGEGPPAGGVGGPDGGGRLDLPDGGGNGGAGGSGGSRYVPADDAAPRVGVVEARADGGGLTGPMTFPGHHAAVTDTPLARLGVAASTLVIEAEGRTGGSPGRTSRAPHGLVAMVPTIVAATLRLLASGAGRSELLPLRLRSTDLVRTVRTGRPNVGLVIVLDASWSMAMDGTFARARALLCGVLDATRRGDRTALIVVGGRRAHVAAPFSRQTGTAADLIMSLRPRGCTPLLDGVQRALSLCADRWAYSGCATPLVLVVTDGRDNLRDGTAGDRTRIAALAATAQRLGVPGAILALRGGSETRFVRLVAERLGWQIHELEAGESA